MRKRTVLLLALLFLAVPAFSSAQDTATPWPPDPNTLFAPGVEVVGITKIEVPSYDPQVGYIDWDTRTAYIWDETTQILQAFPLPDEFPSYLNFERRSDGTIVFTSNFIPELTWLLNPQTGKFSRPETVCGRVRAITGEGQWVIASQTGDAQEYPLCFTETGEITPPLSLPDSDYWITRTSPEQDWVIISGLKRGTVYSYHVPSHTLNQLGILAQSDYSRWEWLDNTFFTIYQSNMPEWSDKLLVIGDVKTPSSLQVVMGHIRFGPEYYDNPPRYELIPGLTGIGYLWNNEDSDPECVLQIFDLKTRQLEEYDLGELCTPNLIQPDDYQVRYFRYVSLDLTQPAVVARYNLRTQQRTDLFEGEIEAIAGVSPAGRYLVLLMDDNGTIDVRPDVLDPISWTPFGHTYWAVYDTEAQKLVYCLDEELIAYDLAVSTNWFGNDVFAFSQRYSGSGYYYIRWVWLDTGETLFTDEVKAQQTSPDGQKIVLTLDKPLSSEVGRCQIKVIDLSARKLIPITQKSNDYCDALPITARWQDNDTLIVTLKPDYQAETAMQYTVRLPD